MSWELREPEFDEAYFKECIRSAGYWYVHRELMQKLNSALDRDDTGEAEHWEAKLRELKAFMKRRQRYYWLTALLVAALFSLAWIFATASDELTNEWPYLSLVFVISTAVLTIVFGCLHHVLTWGAGISFLGCLAVLGWQTFVWLKDGVWIEMSLKGWFSWFRVDLEWKGVAKIINAILEWHFDTSIAGGLWLLSVYSTLR